MIQRTLGDIRNVVSQVAGMTGMSLTDARFIERVNLCQEELMNEGDWPGVVDRWHLLFDEVTGELVLPYWLDRLLQVTVDYCPAQIMSPWAEFVNYGTGPLNDSILAADGTTNLQPRQWVSSCLDRGEVVSHYPIPATGGPWYLRCYATEVEAAGAILNLQGFYNNRLIRSQPDGTNGDWINGVNIGIDHAVPYTETLVPFASLKAVVKPPTNGYIRLVASDGTSEVELSQYAPAETTPSYRNYFIPSLWRAQTGVCNRVVLARARKRYVPVAKDKDVLIISNLNALKCMIIAQWKRDAGSFQEYDVLKGQAIDIMRKEATGYLGKSRTPSISFARGFPLGSLPGLH